MKLIITMVIILLTSSPVYAWFSSPSGFGGSPSGFGTPEPIEEPAVEPVKPAPNKETITANKAPNEVYDTWFAHSPTAKPALPTTAGNGFLFWIGLLAIACGIGLIILIERSNK